MGRIRETMKNLIWILFFLLPIKSFPMDIEIEGSYGWEKYYYGTENENKYYNNNWLGSISFLPFSLTAFQLDYVMGQSILLEDQEYPAGSDNSIVYRKTDVQTETFSINLRQAFNGSDAFIRPMIMIGWARRFTTNSGYQDFRNNTSGDVTRVYQPESNLKQDLTQLALYFKIRIFNGFYFSLSGRTLFEGLEIAKANQNLKIFVGFSWLL